MHPVLLVGSYEDAAGSERVVWSVESSTRPGWDGRFEVIGQVRGVRVSGIGFDALEPDSPTRALSLNGAGELDQCTIVGCTPATVNGADSAVLQLRMELSGGAAPLTTASLVVGEDEFTHSQEEAFEVVLGAVARAALPLRWECCLTCGLSDYNPGGQDIIGMECHRSVREQYLAVRSKADYWGVPVTEEVPEFYRCESYEPRLPGTGYRG